MHVKAKKMAFGGLLLALTIVCMVLGSVIESNTLFLLAAASYFVGIIIRETGMRTGAAFYIAAVLLGFIVAPNKIYVVSFAAMGFYILAAEQAFVMLGRTEARVNRKALFWAIKYIIFNILYIPALIVFQQLLLDVYKRQGLRSNFGTDPVQRLLLFLNGRNCPWICPHTLSA